MNWTHFSKNVRYALKAYLRNPQHLIKNVTWRWAPSRSSEQHIFVVGAPRSGTTLLQILLGNHSACCTSEGETKAFTWQNIFTAQRDIFGLKASQVETFFDECRDLVAFFDACAREFRRERGAHVLVEKTPQHVLQTAFLVEHFPESTVVHIHRDGRDCYCSARSASIPHGETVEEFARYWSKCTQARLDVQSDQVIDLAYEALVSSPRDELKSVMQAVGLQFEENQLSQEQRAADPRARADMFERLSQSINASSVGKWTEELGRDELRAFERIAGAQLEALGYGRSLS